jgi:DNA-binding beta-propeller fold protein YncE
MPLAGWLALLVITAGGVGTDGAAEPASERPPVAGSEAAAARRAVPRVVALAAERTIGQSGTGPIEFHRPGGLVATPVGAVLVADTGNIRVQHVGLNGDLRWEAGGLGTEEGALGRPTAVALAASLNYLVLDSLGQQVLEFHARGEYLGVGIDLGTDAAFARLGDVEPRGIAVDRSGNVILSDRDGDRLLVFAPDWEFLYAVGGFGDDPQSFEDPEGVAVTRHRIFVADSMNGRVSVLDALGTFIAVWELPGGGMPVAVATDRHGNLFVADASGDRIVVFDPEGTVSCTAGATGAGAGSFRRPAGICVVDGRLVVAEADNDRLQVFRLRYDPGP